MGSGRGEEGPSEGRTLTGCPGNRRLGEGSEPATNLAFEVAGWALAVMPQVTPRDQPRTAG
jgi:hypothetical protein